MDTESGLIRYPQPMLLAQIQYLYGMLNGGDQKPGRDAWQRYEELHRELDAWVGEFRGAVTDGQG
jgi:hypothetical protein